ncbi:MAG: PD-(D/E)XK nuclease family protein, partial [bacterium]|nr:PD-(D/E)XK nuclease family protein [bacterium]
KQKTKKIALGLKSPLVGPKIEDEEYLRGLFLEQGLSVTALNNYLTCPWRYFFTNLIRIPEVPSKFQLYGTAVHEALRDSFSRSSGKKPSKKIFLELFSNYLKKKPLNREDYAECLKKGIKSLGGYFDRYAANWQRPVITEFKIAGVFVPIRTAEGEKNILLKGVLDKLELLSGNAVNVVDYKTSKPKTRNEISGLTKNSDGSYKRQLVFYKLLLESYEKGKYSMTSAEIDFTESDPKGEYRKERFLIEQSEVAALRGVIEKTAYEIYSFAFWGNECSKPLCEYCRLRKSFIQKPLPSLTQELRQ